jgi:hypothetical protein
MGNKLFKGKQSQSQSQNQNQNYNSNSQEQEYDEESPNYQQNNSSIKGNQSITRLNIKPDDAQK